MLQGIEQYIELFIRGITETRLLQRFAVAHQSARFEHLGAAFDPVGQGTQAAA
ncbi:hypothetical protein D3C84_915240 [compost metagenome]